jgi:hypothetical protein
MPLAVMALHVEGGKIDADQTAGEESYQRR